MSLQDIAAITVDLFAAAHQPDAHIYPPAGDRRDYVSAPRVLDLAVRLEQAVIAADERCTLTRLVTTNALEEAVEQRLRADELDGMLERQIDVAYRLGSRLTNQNARLDGLLCELGIDSEDLGEDELVPALRNAIAARKPRPSLFARLFG